MTMKPVSIGGAGSNRSSRVAPSRSRRAHSASSASIRSLPWSPGAARTSRWTRFFTVLSSGTVWKKTRGPRPAGSSIAARMSSGRISTPSESRKVFHAANGSSPSARVTPGGPGMTYPSTSAQNRASRIGSWLSTVICTERLIVSPHRDRAARLSRAITSEARRRP
ncbi:Uncharacterised protein [Mycobacteroides abscessus subsp. abscessus]|nr:Uncharacterised protein [Mycobacteroides abscessus subsp. abscessus]